MRGDQITAIRRAINRNLALRAAANGADFFALRGTKSRGFSFFTNHTNHAGSQRLADKCAEYREPGQKAKSLEYETPAHHRLVPGIYGHRVSRTRSEICALNRGES